MLKHRLHVGFEGPRVTEDGLALDDLQKTLTHVQRAVRLMVGHLAGVDASRPGQPSKLVRAQSALRLVRTSPGSFVAELELCPPSDMSRSEHYGTQAVTAILRWKGERDPSLPPKVAAELTAIGTELSEEIDVIRIRTPDTAPSLTIPRTRHVQRAASEQIDASLQGRLMAIDWKRRNAQLHNYGAAFIRLRFDAALDQDMKRLATKYVEVRGRGRFDTGGNWVVLQVEHLDETRSSQEPFDLDEFLNHPHPKIFDPKKVVRASDPFDVDEFMHAIREGRDA